MSPFLRRQGRHERSEFVAKKNEYDSKVKQAIRKVREDYRDLKPPIVDDQFFGAAHIDPKYLSIYLFFKDDEALAEAEEHGYLQLLRGALISALRDECYPQASLSQIEISFASKKAVKDAGGFWTYLR